MNPQHGQKRASVQRQFVRWVVVPVLLSITFLCFSGGEKEARVVTFAGKTMGSTYTVRVADGSLSAWKKWLIRRSIEKRLNEINAELSIFDPGSSISEFNRQGRNHPVKVSERMMEIVRFAQGLARASGGAFDPTVGPLVEVWGFGPKGRYGGIPAGEVLAAARERVGCDALFVDDKGFISKRRDGIQLDLGGIVPGYAVDDIGKILLAHGVRNFLIELGGEVFASGDCLGRKWQVGIRRPDFDKLAGGSLEGVVELSGLALATSGNYQNCYRAKDGRVVGHIIDPRTGWVVSNNVLSVSVVAKDCMLADGLATALFVLGPDDGQAVLKAYGAEALFLVSDKNGNVVERPSGGFARLIRAPLAKIDAWGQLGSGQ